MDSETKTEIPSTGGRADEQSRQEGLSTRRSQQFRTDKFTHFFLLLILVAATIVFFKMIKAFLVPIILAAVFAGLFFPVYSWLLKKAGGRKSLSAFVCCATLSLGLLLPAYAVANLWWHVRRFARIKTRSPVAMDASKKTFNKQLALVHKRPNPEIREPRQT